MKKYPNALICDLAEYYHIHDYKNFAPGYIANLALGLRGDSRIMQKLIGTKVDMQTMLLASILDAENMQVWMRTKDAEHGRNRPKSVLSILNGEAEPQNAAFDSKEAFESARARIIERAKNGN